MSYLNLPRLIFTGDFKSDVSTVNNDPAHYNNATFESSFQEPAQPDAMNGWWNPEGGATFDFVNCLVRQITLDDGSAPEEDIIIGCTVSSPNDRSVGKMVDLDPQQQSVSQLWAVTLTISDAQGELLLQGNIKPVCFRDLQFRQTNLNKQGKPPNGQALGGTWTSVLTNIVWGEKAAHSTFLQKLRAATQGDKLSLNLNAFGYYYAHLDGRFSLGHIIGSLGPWFEGEPELFAPARRLFGILKSPPFKMVHFNFSNFLFEKENKRLTIDFGSSFPVADSIGKISDPILPKTAGIKNPQEFIVGVSETSLTSSPATQLQTLDQKDFTKIGKINFHKDSEWLNKTGGVVVFENIPDETIKKLSGQQLVLLTSSATSPEQFVLVAREAVNGHVIRADECVQRLDHNQTNEIAIYAYQWGEPLASQDISVSLEAPTPVLPAGDPDGSPICETPGNNYPAEGIDFQSTIQTGTDGRAILRLTGNAIHNPRKYIDGQIYFLDYVLKDIPNDPAAAALEPDRISVHLRDYFELTENPTWSEIAETMTQYSNLYPIMSKYIVDLSKPEAVKAKKNILIFAFTRDIGDPLHMPVTRDLSDAKRQAILRWLAQDDLNLGEQPTPLKISLQESVTSQNTEKTGEQIKAIRMMKLKGGGDFLPDDSTDSEDSK